MRSEENRVDEMRSEENKVDEMRTEKNRIELMRQGTKGRSRLKGKDRIEQERMGWKRIDQGRKQVITYLSITYDALHIFYFTLINSF